jgi:hypothetical protein
MLNRQYYFSHRFMRHGRLFMAFSDLVNTGRHWVLPADFNTFVIGFPAIGWNHLNSRVLEGLFRSRLKGGSLPLLPELPGVEKKLFT